MLKTIFMKTNTMRDIFRFIKNRLFGYTYFSGIVWIIAFISYSHDLWSQDLHFSQVFKAPVILNPAGTSDFDGDWRVTNIFRTQGGNFSEPYQTNLIGVDKHVRFHRQLFCGSFFMSNDLSSQNTLQVNEWYATLGYTTRVSVNSMLLFGLQAGYIYKNSTYKNLTLPEQFDMSSGVFNPDLQSSEYFKYSSTRYLDLSGGMIWKYHHTYFESELGLAGYNLNRPEENLMGQDIDLPRKYVGLLALKKDLEKGFYIKPQTSYSRYGKVSEMVSGFQGGYLLGQTARYKSMLYAGSFIRNGFKRTADAVIVSVGIEHANWNVCISYDYDISRLHSLTTRSNAVEISIIYMRPNTFITRKNVPCELY